MSVSVDEYKETICRLTDAECIGGDCDDCDVLKDHNAKSSPAYAKERQREIELRYTQFNNPNALCGVPVITNQDNTIAHIDFDRLILLQDKGIISKTETPYCFAALEQYNHHGGPKLRLFRKYNHLSIPDHIWAKKDFPAAFQWDDFGVYIIAPVIESK